VHIGFGKQQNVGGGGGVQNGSKHLSNEEDRKFKTCMFQVNLEMKTY
jgi:hypothetical protein